jgi:hypothetical protein
MVPGADEALEQASSATLRLASTKNANAGYLEKGGMAWTGSSV